MAYYKDRQDGLVYSTDHGRMCPGCERPADQCICATDELIPAGDGIVRVQLQTKGRKGKGVTVITGAPAGKAELKRLGRELKARCGCGGTVKDGVIEIQGDKRDQVIDLLKAKGWQVKKAGG